MIYPDSTRSHEHGGIFKFEIVKKLTEIWAFKVCEVRWLEKLTPKSIEFWRKISNYFVNLRNHNLIFTYFMYLGHVKNNFYIKIWKTKIEIDFGGEMTILAVFHGFSENFKRLYLRHFFNDFNFENISMLLRPRAIS